MLYLPLLKHITYCHKKLIKFHSTLIALMKQQHLKMYCMVTYYSIQHNNKKLFKAAKAAVLNVVLRQRWNLGLKLVTPHEPTVGPEAFASTQITSSASIIRINQIISQKILQCFNPLKPKANYECARCILSRGHVDWFQMSMMANDSTRSALSHVHSSR